MNIEVVLTPSGGPSSGRVLVASTAQQLVQQIKAALPPGERIDRLRIVDSFGTGGSHPLKSASDLAALRGLFASGGAVEIVSGPVAAAPRGGTVQNQIGLQGSQFGISGMAGRGTDRSGVLNAVTLTQLSSALGVPVRQGS